MKKIILFLVIIIVSTLNAHSRNNDCYYGYLECKSQNPYSFTSETNEWVAFNNGCAAGAIACNMQ